MCVGPVLITTRTRSRESCTVCRGGTPTHTLRKHSHINTHTCGLCPPDTHWMCSRDLPPSTSRPHMVLGVCVFARKNPTMRTALLTLGARLESQYMDGGQWDTSVPTAHLERKHTKRHCRHSKKCPPINALPVAQPSTLNPQPSTRLNFTEQTRGHLSFLFQ